MDREAQFILFEKKLFKENKVTKYEKNIVNAHN